MRRQRGVTGFEWTVIAFILAVAATAMVAVEAQSERLGMTLAIRNMRTGLQLAMAEKLMHGEEAQIVRLIGANPIELIGTPEAAGLGRRWRFDADRGELVYRPRFSSAFEGQSELRWRIVGTADANGRVTGLRLVALPPARPD